MASAPWSGAEPENQLFVLVTGANSGIGLGICQRLADEFAAAHPSPSSHLCIITTTRSASKSQATTDILREYVANRAAKKAPESISHPARIHLASTELDLCNLPSVYGAAERLRTKPLDIYSCDSTTASPTSAHIPRLDSVILNAGIGGWTGLLWGNLAKDVLSKGIIFATTYPSCKGATPGLLVDPLTGRPVDPKKEDGFDEADVLGTVFCSNVFGHYVLVHELLPLLRRPPPETEADPLPPARIIWESSVEVVCWKYLSLDDFQGLRSLEAYESSKRLADVLSLTADLEGVRPFSDRFFAAADADWEDDEGDWGPSTAPVCYVTHPGVVCSSIFPLPAVIFCLYQFAMYLARWIGSPWHPVTAYNGAAAAVWLALLDENAVAGRLDARHVKWGSSASRGGRMLVKRTEVEGWGWRGRLGEEQYDPSVVPLATATATAAGNASAPTGAVAEGASGNAAAATASAVAVTADAANAPTDAAVVSTSSDTAVRAVTAAAASSAAAKHSCSAATSSVIADQRASEAAVATLEASMTATWSRDPLLTTPPSSAPDAPVAYLRNSLGRRAGATPLTAEKRQEFEALGRDCWREMERLRVKWDARVKKAMEEQ